jgi:hypothetical protein
VVIEDCRNAGISLTLDSDRVIQCLTTPETARCLPRVPFGDPFAGLAFVKDEDEDEDPNVEALAAGLVERPQHDGAEADEWDTQNGMPLKVSDGRAT